MSVDDFTYSTAFSNEVFDNGEWYTYAGLETCNIMKSARHGKELLSKSIQSTTQGDSGIDNLTCLSGDDTKLGTDHTKADVYVAPQRSWGDRSDTDHSKCLLLGGRRLNLLTVIPKPKGSGGARAATAQIGPANERNKTK